MRQLTFQPKSQSITLLIVSFLFISLLSGCLNFWSAAQGAEIEPRPMKEKTFYLHTLSETRNIGSIATQHVMDSLVGEAEDTITSNMRIVARWFLFPELADTLCLEGNITLILWYKAQGTRDGATWTLTVNEVDNEGNINLIQTVEKKLPADPLALTETSIGTFVNHTLQLGSTLEAHINIVGNAATDYTIVWGNSTFNSRIVLPTRDYIRIVPAAEGGIWTLDSAFQAQSNFDPEAENKTIYLRAKVTDPFGGYDIKWVNVTVVAPDGTVIPELANVSAQKISGFFNSFESIFQVSWNYSEYPEGRYNITIYALDNNGYFSWLETGNFGNHLEVDQRGFFFIGAPPLEVYIRVFDGDAEALEDATVLVLLGEDVKANATTNSTGYVKVNLAPGHYHVEVWWQKTLVGSEGLEAVDNIPVDTPFEITAAVYHIAFRAVDVQEKELNGAALNFRFPNGQVTDEPLITDEQGIVSLGKSPGGTYGIAVMWRGKVVGDTSLLVDASRTYDINCLVFYANFQAVDVDGETVENALVTVSDHLYGTIVEARLTNASGLLTSRLPTGSYVVSVKWFGVSVLENQNLLVDGNKDVVLTLSIYTVRIIPVDSRGRVLSDATVAVSSGVFSQSANTLDTGGVDLKLPYGDYLAKVRWQNVEVYNEVLILDGTQNTVTLNTNVFYLKVQTYDSLGSPLNYVFVTVQRDGTVVEAADTNAEGNAEFRLPKGVYDIAAFFKTTYYLTYYEGVETATVNLNNDHTTTLIFASFPIPFYLTNLFFFILLLLGAVICFVLVFFFKFRGVAK